MSSDRVLRDVSRRKFLQVTVSGAAMLGAWPQRLTAEEAQAGAAATQPAKSAMNTLGKTGLPVSRVSYGGGQLKPGAGTEMLKRAIDMGINAVHTDTGYGRGRSVAAIGALFKNHPEYRQKVIVCLKNTKPGSESSVDVALKRLGTDYIDVLMPTIHKPEPERLDTIVAFNELMVKKGKVRFGAFTTHDHINDVLELILKQAPDKFDATLLSLSMVNAPGANKGAEDERKRFAANLQRLREHKVGVISMKSGARDAVEKGKDAFEAHCKAVIAGGADTVLTSFTNLAQLETFGQVDLSTLAMTPAQEALAAACTGACLMCGRCANSCPAGVPVSDVMRIASYPDRPGWREFAADEFADLGVDSERIAAACAGCTVCRGACPARYADADAVRQTVQRFGHAVA